MHGLRHASISTGARGGVDPAVVQRRAGHSTVDVTVGIYRHVLDTEGSTPPPRDRDAPAGGKRAEILKLMVRTLCRKS